MTKLNGASNGRASAEQVEADLHGLAAGRFTGATTFRVREHGFVDHVDVEERRACGASVTELMATMRRMVAGPHPALDVRVEWDGGRPVAARVTTRRMLGASRARR